MTANSLRTPRQELLLQAALSHGRDALNAWEQWRATTDLYRAPPGSGRLLPLIHRNLEPLETDYSDLGRLKGTRRRTWVQNQLLFRVAADVLRSLQDAGVETMLLRGAALVTEYYRDAGVRPMRNTDILVPESQTPEAVRILRDSGWREVNPAFSTFTSGFRRAGSSIAFRSSADVEVRLHWHVLSCCPSGKTDAWFWRASRHIEFQGAQTRTLLPSDQFLYTCLAGLQWSYEPPFWRVADTLTVLNACDAIEPERFLSLAAEQRLGLLLYRSVEDLREHFGACIPETLPQSLAAAPVSRTDRHEFACITQPYRERTPAAWIAGTYRQHQRSGQGTFAGHLWRSLRWAVLPHVAEVWGLRGRRRSPQDERPEWDN